MKWNGQIHLNWTTGPRVLGIIQRKWENKLNYYNPKWQGVQASSQRRGKHNRRLDGAAFNFKDLLKRYIFSTRKGFSYLYLNYLCINPLPFFYSNTTRKLNKEYQVASIRFFPDSLKSTHFLISDGTACIVDMKNYVMPRHICHSTFIFHF